MLFTNRFRRNEVKLSGERNLDLYPHNLQLYKYAPENTISLEEFEKLALERLQVLRAVDRAGAKHPKNSAEYKESVVKDLKNQKVSFYYKINVDDSYMRDEIYDERKRDHISHFILRLAYCRSEFLRSWFINQEVDLFKLRFTSEPHLSRKRFMELNELDYKPIENNEKKKLLSKLAACSLGYSSTKVEGTEYYKVPFTEVLDLVKCRRVFLRDGEAYLPEHDLVSIVVSAFRCHLSQALAITSRALPHLEEDRRLLDILNTLHERYIGTNYSKKRFDCEGDVTPEMLDDLSKVSFPLCMKTMHDNLRKTHHLKYFGRLQYGLFLKGIGLSLDDSLRFWRQEFGKTLDIDKFDKRYAYGIRYNYGKEGKRANFTPYSCMKVISSQTPGPGDCHGCPFKHSDTANLRQKLQELRIGNTTISEIVGLAEKNHYQLACTRCFEATHNEATVDQAISHPNQYFEASQKLKKGTAPRKERSSSQVPTSQVVIYGNSQPSSSSATATNEVDDIDMDDIEDLLKGI